MFFRNVKTAAIVVVTGLAVATTAATIGWHKVDEARRQGLPRTTMAELDTIITNSLQNKLYAEAVKAICTKIGVEGQIQGNKAEEKITRLQAEIAKAPAEMKPILEAVLAHWYWQYCQQNWYRFVDRTRTTQSPSGEFDTWDLPRLLRTIDDHFQKALAAEAILQATSITNYAACTYAASPSMPDACRPTLWDFLAHDAIASYSADVRAGAQAEDAFVLQADSPVFGTTAEFLAWQIECTDDTSPTVKALRLFQALLRFHQHDAQRDAFLDNELLRLEFGARKAVGEGTVDYYKQALQRYAEAYASHPFAARARATWATLVQEEDQDAVTAHAIAAKGVADFPDSMGGTACQNLLKQLEAKELEVASEYVWNTSTQALAVTYRNIDQVYFRVVAADYDGRFPNNAKWDSELRELLGRHNTDDLLKQPPVKDWSCVLPAATNYQKRTVHITPPADLKPGYYYLLFSHRPDFSGTNSNRIDMSPFWVSKLALIVRPRYGTGIIEGLVLDAQSGAPIPGAKVGGWVHGNSRFFGERWRALGAVATDTNGCFRIPANHEKFLLTAAYRGDKVAMVNTVDSCRHERKWPVAETVLFTDRNLYRPGQMVRYKGICLQSDQAKANYAVRAGTRVTVILRDPNNEEVARQMHTASAYGSFDGSFVIPRNRGTGSMSIATDDEERSFNVEEYKRPKFQVAVDAPAEPAKLGARVTVTGQATAYSGAAMAGATVRYRVARIGDDALGTQRRSRRRDQPAKPNDQEIAHGIVTTAEDGSFTFRFMARPDPDGEDQTSVRFAVQADVTDLTGETRSGQRCVTVGPAALRVQAEAGEWLTPARPVALKIRTTSFDGEPVATNGLVKLYRLIQPTQVARARLPTAEQRGRNNWWYYGLAQQTPADPNIAETQASPDNWDLGEMVEERAFTTGATGEALLDFRLAAGAYRAVVTSQDAFGQVVTTRLSLLVVDETARQCALRVPDLVRAVSWTVAPGETFQALWGGGYDAARAFVEIEQDGRTLCAYWTPADRTQVSIQWPVTEAMRGGFTLHVTSVHDNRAYVTSRLVDVPWSNKVLNVRWEHFVSLLGPGKRETWTAVVSGTNASCAAAEMVATLYDASLDQYQPHYWQRAFDVFRREGYSELASYANVMTLVGGAKYRQKVIAWQYRVFCYDMISSPMQYNSGSDPDEDRDDRGMLAWMGYWVRHLPDFFGGVSPYRVPKGRGEPVVNVAKMVKIKRGGLPETPKYGRRADSDVPVGLDDVKLRRNFDETACFFPHLLCDSNGVVRLAFTMPETLTEWKFMAFAHDRELRSGYLEDRAATTKALMVQPNPPRFVREGDTLEFTVKVGNLSATSQTGTVRLALADAQTGQDRSAALGLRTQEFIFDIPAQAAQTFAWRITIPDGCGFLTYRAVAASDRLSDGEEGYLPVLSRRIPVLESLPLPIRGAQTKTFAFSNLLQSGNSPTLQHANLTVQMVSQPAWYAVMALPYLMEAPEERSDAVFNRLYANNVAGFIGRADPKIRRVIDQWRTRRRSLARWNRIRS
jgi:hypothetical protein